MLEELYDDTSIVRFPSRMFYGSLLAGWGAFNLIEGVIDHHILQIHHVKESPDHLWWDLGFLALEWFLYWQERD